MTEIVYVAGEASGDRHAAALHRAMLARAGASDLTAWGIGARLMSEAGVELIANSSKWGAIGVVESLAGMAEYTTAMARIKALILKRKPDALILVDFGFFNVRLARWAKSQGIGPVIYYMPPGSWKRRQKPEAMRELGELCDLIVTPFQWSNDGLKSAGANSHWLGHPLVDIAAPTVDPADFAAAYGIDSSFPVVALLPGSRSAEVRYILPTMLSAATLIAQRVPGVQFLLAAAPNLDRRQLEKTLRAAQERSGATDSRLKIIESAGDKLKRIAAGAIDAASPSAPMVTNEGFVVQAKRPGDSEPPDKPWRQASGQGQYRTASLAIVENMTYDSLAHADLAIVCSGTATLEAAILGRPMIITYYGSKLMIAEWRMRKRRLGIEFIGLPNIVAGEMIVPEILEESPAQPIAEKAIEMLLDPELLMRQKRKIQEIVMPALGERGVIARVADLIWRTVLGSDAAPGNEVTAK